MASVHYTDEELLSFFRKGFMDTRYEAYVEPPCISRWLINQIEELEADRAMYNDDTDAQWEILEKKIISMLARDHSVTSTIKIAR